ncbi:MAG: hypothetical protein ACOCTQ_04060 [Planctomycetota bacterium]
MDKKKKDMLSLLGAVAVIVVVLAIVFYPADVEPDGASPDQSAEDDGGASEGEEEPGDELGGWGELSGGDRTKILVSAADNREVVGQMEEGAAESEDGQEIVYLGVPAGTCGEEDDPTEHQAVLDVEVEESGTYYPWARVWWADSCGNSIEIRVEDDGEEVDSFRITDGSYEWWHWLPMAGSGGLQLDAGAYTLRVVNREDGARLHRILLVNEDYESYTPTGPEG